VLLMLRDVLYMNDRKSRRQLPAFVLLEIRVRMLNIAIHFADAAIYSLAEFTSTFGYLCRTSGMVEQEEWNQDDAPVGIDTEGLC
jgi:hypothetical protein